MAIEAQRACSCRETKSGIRAASTCPFCAGSLEAVLRRALKEDLPALVELERVSFTVPNWPADIFLRYECMVAEVAGQLAGFLVSREIFAGGTTAPPEREILNLAVDPRYRRAGLATLLMQAEFSKNAIFFLEVRESNLAAQALYKRLGFVEISRRPEYYNNPTETAIVMRMK